MPGRIGRAIRALGAAGAVLAALLVALLPAPPRADLSGLAEAGAGRKVRILRDAWGVPHVFGKTDADAAYGLAYAHAEDDFLTIQGALLAARGRLASVYGRGAAANDYLVALLRVRETVDERYEKDLSPETRAVCEAYAEGINRYAVLHPAEALPGLYPLRGRDVVAGFVHKLPLFFGLDRVLKELLGPVRLHSVSRKGPRQAARRTEELDPPFGSNALAVSPRRSADGFTRLAVNSHQPWAGPVAWYEAQVRSDEGWDMTGGVFPGAPIVLHGHNGRLGWAMTVNQPDLVDVYVLETNPDNPNQYRFDGAWRDFEAKTAAIDVKLLGRLHWTFHREVLWSVHGPVLRRPHGTYALRFAGMGEVRQVQQWYRLNKARSQAEWREAMAMNAIPMFNFVYADGEGDIEYVYNAKLPLRASGYDWTEYLPGDTSETLWSRYLPYDRLPRVTNPPSGFLVSCNGTPFAATVGPGNPDPAAYSPTFGIETGLTNRARRALELMGADAAITRGAFTRYKFDTAYSRESSTARRLRTLVDGPPPADPLARLGQELLRSWDLDAGPDSRAAALALLTLRPVHNDQPPPVAPDELRLRLEQAAHALEEHFGGLDVPWGEVNRLRRGGLDLPLGGGPDTLRAVYARPAGDGRLVGWAGDSYILLVEWDPQGQVHSRSISPYGSATLDPRSPHYADQAPLFARQQLKPVWRDEAEIRAHLEREYDPGSAPRQ